MLFRLVRPMKRKDSRNGYFQQRIPADIRARAAGRSIEFALGEETLCVVISGSAQAIKFSLRSSDPAEVKVRQAAVTARLELYWKALRQDAPIALTHRQCVALAGRAYRAWASEPRRETTTGMVRVPIGKPEPGQMAKHWTWVPDDGDAMDGEPGAWAPLAESIEEEKLGPLADRLLLAEGIGPVDDASRETLHREIARALRLAFQARERNASGDYRPDEMAERFPPEFERPKKSREERRPSKGARSSSSKEDHPGGVSLMILVEDWWREAVAGGMSLSTYESYRQRGAEATTVPRAQRCDEDRP